MGQAFLYSLIVLLILTIISFFALIYSIKIKKNIGIIVSSVFLIFFLSIFFTNNIEEFEFNKENVTQDLKFLNVKLNDNFKIADNRIEGMPERYQYTKLIISENDRNRLINEIKCSKNFKELKSTEDIENDTEFEERFTNKGILNYKYPDFYSRELFDKIDNYPTRLILQIDEKSDTLSYQRIED